MKLPVPVPSLDFVLNAIVGFRLVDHTTPRDVIVQPPSDVILPPERAVVDLIESAAVVVSVEGVLTVSQRQRTEAPGVLLEKLLTTLPAG